MAPGLPRLRLPGAGEERRASPQPGPRSTPPSDRPRSPGTSTPQSSEDDGGSVGPSPAAPKFSADKLLDHLDSAGDPAVAGTLPWWKEYREALWTGALGLMVLLAVLAYQAITRSPEPVTARVVTPEPEASSEPAETKDVRNAPKPRADSAPPKVDPSPLPSTPAGDETPSEPAQRKSATPMLTVVTKPSGALVEINGVIYGKSPLIMPSPPQLRSLNLALKLPGYSEWEGNVSPNEAGHFSVNVDLVPMP